MNRRSFLSRAGAISAGVALQAKRMFAQEPPPDLAVEKVHLVFKTHLDVGFTDMAAKVMETYFDRFIPGIMSLTEQIEREHRKDRYIWTTGSWLINRYLEESCMSPSLRAAANSSS